MSRRFSTRRARDAPHSRITIPINKFSVKSKPNASAVERLLTIADLLAQPLVLRLRYRIRTFHFDHKFVCR